jgi:hypothetical protein
MSMNKIISITDNLLYGFLCLMVTVLLYPGYLLFLFIIKAYPERAQSIIATASFFPNKRKKQNV